MGSSSSPNCTASRPGASVVFGPHQALIRPDDVHHGVDEREVGERLREVAQVASAVRLDLLGVEQQRAGVREQLLAQRPGPVQLADLGERRDEPERADRERALLTRQPVVGLLHAVAQHQAVDRQLVGDRQDGCPHAFVGGRQESHEREQKQRGVQGVGFVVLHEDAAVVGPVRADVVVHLLGGGFPALGRCPCRRAGARAAPRGRRRPSRTASTT